MTTKSPLRHRIPTVTEAPTMPMWPNVATLFGLHRARAYTLAKYGDFPVRCFQVGSRWRCATADVRRALGLDVDDAA
jgi:hypothetical protein